MGVEVSREKMSIIGHPSGKASIGLKLRLSNKPLESRKWEQRDGWCRSGSPQILAKVVLNPCFIMIAD
jgi:hypothetical protein